MCVCVGDNLKLNPSLLSLSLSLSPSLIQQLYIQYIHSQLDLDLPAASLLFNIPTLFYHFFSSLSSSSSSCFFFFSFQSSFSFLCYVVQLNGVQGCPQKHKTHSHPFCSYHDHHLMAILMSNSMYKIKSTYWIVLLALYIYTPKSPPMMETHKTHESSTN